MTAPNPLIEELQKVAGGLRETARIDEKANVNGRTVATTAALAEMLDLVAREIERLNEVIADKVTTINLNEAHIARLEKRGTFEVLRQANLERQQEWNLLDSGERVVHPLTYRTNELAGEVGEVCNVAKKLEREGLGLRGKRAQWRDLADELGDAQACLDLVAMAAGLDLYVCTARKFNEKSEELGLATRMVIP